jgi:hypothetical protein
VSAARLADATREDGWVSYVVPRAAPATACIAVEAWPESKARRWPAEIRNAVLIARAKPKRSVLTYFSCCKSQTQSTKSVRQY